MDSQAYIRKQLNSRLKRRPMVAAQSVIPQQEKSGFLGKFLGICILLMAVAICMAGVAKGMGFDFKTERQITQRQPHTRVQPRVIERPIDNTSQLRADIASLETKVVSLEERQKIWKHRVWLLSIASNENANISKEIDRRYHGNQDSGFITFGEEWKMNRMPQTMDLTQEQRDALRRHIR